MVGRRFEFEYGRFNRILLPLLGLGWRRSRLVLDDQHIDACMGWAFNAVIPVANIAKVTKLIAGERPSVGWGVHGWRGNWLVNGSLQQLVSIESEPPVPARVCGYTIQLRKLSVSLADDEAFLHALRSGDT